MNGFRRLSIRWRITIGSVLVAAVLLAGAVFVARTQIAQVQINADKKLLYSASTPYIAQIRNHPAQIDQPAGEQRVAVLDPGGSIVASNLPAPLAARPDIFADLKSGSHFVTFAGVHYLVTVESVDSADGTWKIVASRDQQPTELVLANLTNILVGGAAVLLVGFGLASWLLTAAALRPVTQMRRRAELLRATNSAEPLPVGPAKDELAALAVTLNNFIDHVRKTAAREKQMVSDASHEIRTPLAVLKIQLELAHLSEGDAAALRGDLVRAEATVDRLSRLATSLLELSVLESDRGTTATAWQSLLTEFVGASDRARLLALRAHVSVDFSVEEGIDTTVYRISRTHFSQVLDNLVNNAVRAVPPGGEVSARLFQSGTQLRMTVEDSGSGMPDTFIPIAFDRFSRPDEQRGSAEGGNGLGLSIVAAIVANAGGTITLANRTEGGLTAEVILPNATQIDTNP